MSYSYTFNNDSAYLVHFNKNHDKRGRFAVGDGDGDGVRDERKTKKNNEEVLKEYFTKNAKRNSAFTKYAEAASGLKTAKRVSTGILAGGVGAGAIMLGAGFLLDNPALLVLGLESATAGTVYGTAGLVGSFIEERRLTHLMEDFEKYDVDSGVDQTVNVKKA